jgi:hypothetical protein
MDLFKVENLPELVEGQPYNASQYDATKDLWPSPKDPYKAAALLQWTGDDVNYKEDWNVLRDMTDDEEYCDKVLLAHMVASQLALAAWTRMYHKEDTKSRYSLACLDGWDLYIIGQKARSSFKNRTNLLLP